MSRELWQKVTFVNFRFFFSKFAGEVGAFLWVLKKIVGNRQIHKTIILSSRKIDTSFSFNCVVLFKTESIHKHIIYTPLTDFEGCIVFFIFLKNRLHTINDTKIICAKLGISDCPKFHHNWSLLAVITRKKLFSQQKFLKKKAFFLKCFLFLKFCFDCMFLSFSQKYLRLLVNM